MIPVIFGVSILIFIIMYFTPGDVVQTMLGPMASEADLNALRDKLGLNDSFIVQLIDFLKQLYLNRNLGSSYVSGTNVMSEIISRLPRTALLAGACCILQLIFGIILGVTAAVHQNKWQDWACTLISLIGISVPAFWLALMMIVVFSNNLQILPSFGIGSWRHWVMPIISAALNGIGVTARQTRSQMLEVIRSDYIVTARAKGVSELSIRYHHALPNALIPVITGLGTSFGTSLGGSVVIETAFSIPGVGKYMVDGITNRDLPVIRGGVVILAILFCVVMLLVDLIYAFIDPRIKAQYENQSKQKRGKKNG